MTLGEESLTAIWTGLHRKPGWLSRAVESLGLDREDENFLNELDDAAQELSRYGKLKDREWARKAAEIRAKNPEISRASRIEYLTAVLADVRRCLAEIDESYHDLSLQGVNPITRLMWLWLTNEPAMRLKQIQFRGELNSLQNNCSGSLDDAKIERARAFPLENLVKESIKAGKMLCPLHDDKSPSMMVKNGFGYCFSCGGVLDSIGYMMKIRGLSFKEAVEGLQ